MNGNNIYMTEDFDEDIDFEDYDESAEDYDEGESYDDEGIEAEFLDRILGAVTPPIVSSVGGAVSNAVGGLFSPRPRPRQYRPAPQVPVGRGINSAVLQTPRGSATLRLPTNVPTREELQRTVASLREGINRNTTAINTTQKDLSTVRTQLTALSTSITRDITNLRKDTRTALSRSTKAQQAAIAKLRKEQRSKETTNLLLSMMLQRQLQEQVDTHAHPAWTHTHTVDATSLSNTEETSNPVAPGSISSPPQTGGSNMGMMLLPLMLSGGNGGGDDNNMMMMMMMMFAMQNRS